MNTYPHRESVTRTSIRTAIGLGALAPLLLAAAATASADPANGTYDAETSQGQIGLWTITSCGPDCAHIHNEGARKNADPDLGGNPWDATVSTGHGWLEHGSGMCPDGTEVTFDQNYSINLGTMTGDVMVIPRRCAAHGGKDALVFDRDFTLTKIS